MRNKTSLAWAIGLLATCWACSKPTAIVDREEHPSETPVQLANATFYLAGMNQKLQIL